MHLYWYPGAYFSSMPSLPSHNSYFYKGYGNILIKNLIAYGGCTEHKCRFCVYNLCILCLTNSHKRF